MGMRDLERACEIVEREMRRLYAQYYPDKELEIPRWALEIAIIQQMAINNVLISGVLGPLDREDK